jgi:thimet oligopeptidase
MKNIFIPFFIISFIALFIFYGYQKFFRKESLYMLPKLYNVADIKAIFPTTVEEFKKRVKQTLEKTGKGIETIIAIPALQRTFENTIEAIDRTNAHLSIMGKIAWTLQNLSPDDAIRAATHQGMIDLQNFDVDMISNNVALYKAVKEYVDHTGKSEQLSSEEKRYLNDLIKKFEKNGLNLPEDQQEKVKEIKKELNRLSLEFHKNINTDNRFIAVTAAELQGLPPEFIAGLKKDEQGKYRVGVDYPTYFAVIENCTIASTRHALWREFVQRAYPANSEVLKKMIAERHRLAQFLGFESYAALEIDDEMAKTPERVRKFLQELRERAEKKSTEEMQTWKKSLPAGVTLTDKNQFKPWDIAYVKSEYKKKHLDLDEEKLKEYFPMQKTVDEILDIYQKFLDVEFRQLPITDLWHPDVRYVAIHAKDGSVLGHLLLDLYPRPNKYSHACMDAIAPAVKDKDGTYHVPLIVVVANFPKPLDGQPALLRRDDVNTFFHEFGHAMHGIFGATRMAGYSGVNTTLDFVEIPSQMLEEWMYDYDILKKITSHYQTGESLDDATITKIIAIKKFGAGSFIQRQVMQSLLALRCFEAGDEKDPALLNKNLSEEFFGRDILFDMDNHFEAAFGHLDGYGSRYYCYMWSKVFALDMFDRVKKYGLLNPEIGREYVEKVIGKGGSVDPEVLIENFLERKPVMDAFVKDLGLI